MKNGNAKIDILKALETVKNKDGSAFFYSPCIYKDEYSYLLTDPLSILESFAVDNFFSSVAKLDELSELTAIGYLSYEASYLMEKRLNRFIAAEQKYPLMKFYLYQKENVRKFSSEDISYNSLIGCKLFDNYKITGFNINTGGDQYIKNIEKIKEYIEAGDTYQVNYTVKGGYAFEGDIISLFLSLIFNQSAKYIAFINDGSDYIISVSPELFFKIKGKDLFCKPMKGTIGRGYNFETDRLNHDALENSGKDKSENIMIVDLLRNDMGKISEFGSVKADTLFEIEKYETLFQMTSAINSKLKPGITISDVLKNLFPCGSITGAPKIRTMEIIQELESEKRNIYTGAVGIINQNESVFNVPIRTLVISKESGKGEIGIGGGIVWDSLAESEFRETSLKSNFLCKPDSVFNIFTTMLIENNQLFLPDKHLTRLRETARFFLFNFDEKQIERKLTRLLKKTIGSKTYRVKVILDKWGNCQIEMNEFQLNDSSIDVLISKTKISSCDKFQYFKTTNRVLYDREYKKATEKGFGEILFFNEKNKLAEGAVSNVFLKRNGGWFTPEISSGILNGIYREYLLNMFKDYKETDLTSDNIRNADEIILTNSLRKEIKVANIYFE
ncbi:MAG: aminodeoxychorismate synthase component I [Ignavibacteria bacterium]